MIGPAPTLGGGLYAAGSGGGFCDVTTSTVDTAAPPSPCIMPLGNPAGFAFNPIRPTGGGKIGVFCIIVSDGHVECGLLGGGGGSGGGGGNCSGGGDNIGGNKILYNGPSNADDLRCYLALGICDTCGGGTGPPPPGGGPPGGGGPSGGGDCPPGSGGSCTPPPGGPAPPLVPNSTSPHEVRNPLEKAHPFHLKKRTRSTRNSARVPF